MRPKVLLNNFRMFSFGAAIAGMVLSAQIGCTINNQDDENGAAGHNKAEEGVTGDEQAGQGGTSDTKAGTGGANNAVGGGSAALTSGGTTGSGGSAMGAGGSTGGAGSAGNPGQQTATAGAAAGGNAGAGGNADPCVGEETPSNDTAETATSYTLDGSVVGCVNTREDKDFYEFMVPADQTGGYVQVNATEVGNGTIKMFVFAASDNGWIGEITATTNGQKLNLWFAAASGQKYHVMLQHKSYGGFEPFRYTLKATYTKIPDPFEPNDTRDMPKEIVLKTPVEAYFYAGYTSSARPTNRAYEDWYSVTLGAAPVTVKIENVASDINAYIGIRDSSNNLVAEKTGAPGVSVDLENSNITANKYAITVSTNGAAVAAIGFENVADHCTRPYKLTVSQ